MPPRPWASGTTRAEWLRSRGPEYREALAQRTITAWLKKTYVEWFAAYHWNLPDKVEPPADGNVEVSEADSLLKEEKMLKKQKQIKSWFRREFDLKYKQAEAKFNGPGVVASKHRQQVLSKRTKPRKPQRTHVYSRLFYKTRLSDKISTYLRQRKDSALTAQNGGAAIASVSKMIKQAWDIETDETKAIVEAEVERLHALAMKNFNAKTEEGYAPSNEDLCDAIQNMGPEIDLFLSSLHLRTQLSCTLLIGGPNPLCDGKLMVTHMHRGVIADSHPSLDFAAWGYDALKTTIIPKYAEFINLVYSQHAGAELDVTNRTPSPPRNGARPVDQNDTSRAESSARNMPNKDTPDGEAATGQTQGPGDRRSNAIGSDAFSASPGAEPAITNRTPSPPRDGARPVDQNDTSQAKTSARDTPNRDTPDGEAAPGQTRGPGDRRLNATGSGIFFASPGPELDVTNRMPSPPGDGARPVDQNNASRAGARARDTPCSDATPGNDAAVVTRKRSNPAEDDEIDRNPRNKRTRNALSKSSKKTQSKTKETSAPTSSSTDRRDTSPSSTLAADDVQKPEWLVHLLKGMADSENLEWTWLLDVWIRIEASNDYDKRTPKGTHITTVGRTAWVKWWVQRHRDIKTKPPIPNDAGFGEEWWKWWTNAQPLWRTERDRMGRVTGRDSGNWIKLKVGGNQGVMLFIITLFWWKCLAPQSSNLALLNCAIADVTFALTSALD